MGNAYTCNSPSYRLNVREDLPIVFSEDPLHFARWAKTHLQDPQAKSEAGYFYRRHDFGRYVSLLLNNAPVSHAMRRIRAKVKRIDRLENQWRLGLDSGAQVDAQHVILATGNGVPTWPCGVDSQDASSSWLSSHLIENPWPGDHWYSFKLNDDIILIGGGLTALDAINALAEQGHQGRIQVVSPRAIFPPAQAPWQRRNQPEWPNSLNPAGLVKFMRAYLPSAPTNSSEWQCAWEELRPHLNPIWQSFNPHQRRILLKRFGWLWSLYRFRASPQTIEAYEQFRAKGQFNFALGRASQIRCIEPKLTVILSNGTEITGDRVINCTGVSADRLLQQLIKDKLAIPDALLQGVAVDTKFRVLSPSQVWEHLWMIGPATMGSIGDVVAASAIAKQAEQLAKTMTQFDHVS